MKLSYLKPLFVVAMASASLACAAPRAIAGSTTYAPAPQQSTSSMFEEWWNGSGFTGNWFGLRDTFKNYGLTFGGKYDGAFFGVIDSQRGSRGFWDQQLSFNGKLNFGELLGVELLETTSIFGEVRWRDDRPEANANSFVQASGLFNPSAWRGGLQWRLLNFGLQISSKNYLPIKDMVVLKGGWLQPQKEFIDQPPSKLFLNNSLNSAKGIGGNIPFSGSFSSWGGTLEVKPTEWSYTKGGLFMAYPRATDTGNHGLAFEGFAQDPSENGLMVMGEMGVTPKIGSSKLPGKYAFGGYYWGNRKASFNGTNNWGQYGFYWQADQMLFREPQPFHEEPPPAGKGAGVSSAKNYKQPVAPKSKPKLSDQGLSIFNLVTFAPSYNNLYPFYFHTGLNYKGLIPGRDNDQTMFSLAFSNYSYDSNLARRAKRRAWQDYTMILEWGHRIQINKWAHLQPFAQYVIRPNGTDHVENGAILGFSTGVTF